MIVPLFESHGHFVYHATAGQLASYKLRTDTLITDAPYSARVHDGHADGTSSANAWAAERGLANKRDRRGIVYASWGARDVVRFVRDWSPLVSGWFVSITDHGLAPAWERALRRVDRYVFAPVPVVAPGSRIRLSGDGPSCWGYWVIAARPKSKTWLEAWRERRRKREASCALPGGYVIPEGEGKKPLVVGGKPLWLMRRLIGDYSEPGERVCDPCAGAGTTGEAAHLEGRRALLGDASLEHAQLAAVRMRDAVSYVPPGDARQILLFGETL